MSETLKEKLTPRNPLGIIALFVSFIEAVATVSLKFVADAKVPSLLWLLVLFIVSYPTLIAISFFVILWKRREILFGPMDYADPKGFENILLKKVERIEAKQDAANIDVATALQDIYQTIDKLIELNAVLPAINVGQVFLNKKDYEKSLKVFQYILSKVSPSNELYYKVIANIAYSHIGKSEYDAAIENLVKLKSLNKGERFSSWHALSLAYAYFKAGKRPEYRRWVNQAKELNNGEEYGLDIDFFAALYPEIDDDIRKLFS